MSERRDATSFDLTRSAMKPQAPDGQNLANPVVCLKYILVLICWKMKKNTGDGAYLYGGSGHYLTTRSRSIVLRRFRNPGTVCGCHLSLTTCLLFDLGFTLVVSARTTHLEGSGSRSKQSAWGTSSSETVNTRSVFKSQKSGEEYLLC
jgi:hypothetical protein